MSKRRGSRTKSQRRPVIVGLTGSFGAGKSTVAKLFRCLGAHVLDADQLAHEVFQKKNPYHERLRFLFPEIRGLLTRAKIARIVFHNERRRQKLERLIHPYVFNRIEEETARTRRPVLVVEVPLLFESGFHHHTDSNVVVNTGKKAILARLRRKGYSAEEVAARWRAQMDSPEKIRKADYVINNTRGLEVTRARVLQIWNQIERSLLTHAQRKTKR